MQDYLKYLQNRLSKKAWYSALFHLLSVNLQIKKSILWPIQEVHPKGTCINTNI